MRQHEVMMFSIATVLGAILGITLYFGVFRGLLHEKEEARRFQELGEPRISKDKSVVIMYYFNGPTSVYRTVDFARERLCLVQNGAQDCMPFREAGEFGKALIAEAERARVQSK